MESAILKLTRYDGAWGHTRVRWTRTEHHDTPRYAQVVREVALHRDGAISYGDLRALERGNWELQAAQEIIAISDESCSQEPLQWLVQGMFEQQSARESPLVDALRSPGTAPEGTIRPPAEQIESGFEYIRKEQVFVCQPDGLVLNDHGRASPVARPIALEPASMRSEKRWLAAVRACGEDLKPTALLIGPGAYVQFECAERRVSAFQRILKGISILGAVCFIPPEHRPQRSTSGWIASLLPPCPNVILAAYAAGAVAVYEMRTWEEMQALGAEIPHGEYYVCLGCKAARGGDGQSYFSKSTAVGRDCSSGGDVERRGAHRRGASWRALGYPFRRPLAPTVCPKQCLHQRTQCVC